VARGTTLLLPFVTRLARLQPVRARSRGRSAAETGHATRLRIDECYRCGGEVADALARLGSTLCHDCRDASPLPGR
jgi:hypothetical protein